MKRLLKTLLVCLIMAGTAYGAPGAGAKSDTSVSEQKNKVEMPPVFSPEEVEKEISAQKEQMEIIKRSTGAETPVLEQSKVLKPGIKVLIQKEVIEFREPKYPIKNYSVSFASPVSFIKDPDESKKPVIYTQPSQPNQNQSQGTAQSTQVKNIFVRAFCTADRDYVISLVPVPGELTCMAEYEGIGKKVIKVRGEFVPDLRTYTLRFVPHNFPGCSRFKFYVMNGDRTSYNVAGYVDKKRLQNVLLYTLRDTGTDTAEFLKKAFLEAGKTLVYSDNGNLQEVQVNDRTGKVGKYAAYSFGANLMTNIAKEIAKEGGLPPLFKVYKNQPIYIEGYCEYSPETLAYGEVR